MLIKIWPKYWQYQLERVNMKADEDIGRAVGMVIGSSCKVCRLLSNKFWKNVGCLVADPTFGLGPQGFGRRTRYKI